MVLCFLDLDNICLLKKVKKNDGDGVIIKQKLFFGLLILDISDLSFLILFEDFLIFLVGLDFYVFIQVEFKVII